MRHASLRSLVIALALTACHDPSADSGDAGDPLDPDTLAAIAQQQGSANGSDHAGSWSFAFTQDDCDCPPLSFAGDVLDPCDFAPIADGANLTVTVSQIDGFLAASLPDQQSLTGPVDADGSFILAGNHDLATVAGPLQLLTRLDGSFAGSTGGTEDTAMGEVAQRLRGTLADDTIDCRWRGGFTAHR